MAVLAVLVIVQGWALARQFALGFRPFRHAATRVPFSWDMFAIDIERCDVRWSPSLSPKDGRALRVARISELSPTPEWNPVFETSAQYARFAQAACERFGDYGAHATLTCFDDAFHRTEQVLACR